MILIGSGAMPSRVSWVPRLPQAQLTEAFGTFSLGLPSAAALAVSSVDYYIAVSEPWTALLPAAILEIIQEEPSGAIGLSYRRYIKSSLLPTIRQTAAILRSHMATIE